MNPLIKTPLQSLLLVGAFFAGATDASAETTLVYPNEAAPLFSIEVPNNWKLAPAQSADQFFQVAGPAGVSMWFRAKPVTSEKEVKAAVEAATKSGKEWLAENYKDVVLEEIVAGKRDGMDYFSYQGAGVYNRTGDAVDIAVAFIAMPNGSLAQFWSIIPKDAVEGLRYVEKVLKSFTPR
jgi:hypothetical protein